MRAVQRRLLALTLLACAPLGACSAANDADEAPVVVFVAASMAGAVEEIARVFEADTGRAVRLSEASTATLARQIAMGAPADVFVSADPRWIDALATEGLIIAGSRVDLAANSLVIAAPTTSALAIDLGSDPPALATLAIGDPAHVPAGQSAREALRAIGWWSELAPIAVTAPDARAALRLLEIGAAEAGVVYASDALASEHTRVLARIPQDMHAPIRYSAALCTVNGAAFFDALLSDSSAAALERAGLVVLPAALGAPGP